MGLRTLLVLAWLGANPAAAHDVRVAVFTNPFKPLLGLMQLGIEVQVDARVALVSVTEYAFMRTGLLDRIRHPDFVASLGCRYAFACDDALVSGTFLGLRGGLAAGGRGPSGRAGRDVFVGVDAGRKLPLDGTGYGALQASLACTLRKKQFLPGVEAALGKVL